MMYTREFPFCCGAYVICNFGGTSTSLGTKSNKSLGFIKNYVENEIKRLKDRALIFCIFNKTQYNKYGKLMEDLGFRICAEGYNKPHCSTCITLVYENKKSK